MKEVDKFFKYLEDFERTKDSRPIPIEKDGDLICPICGAKAVRSPEVMLPRWPIYTYCCTRYPKECIYAITSRVYLKNFPEEVLPHWLTQEKYEMMQQYVRDKEQSV